MPTIKIGQARPMPAGRNNVFPQIFRACFILWCLLSACWFEVRSAVSAQDFYSGRTITIIVSGGGEYEAYARAFAEFMPKHIPGHPNMIVQLMPGGGGLQAANFIYKIAPKDGTFIAGTHGA